ncbi:MAG: dienelactone hydrolase family protein [Candidatus Acidiferrales bacterium]
MMEKEISIQTADGTVDGWLYQPEKTGSWPGVIFLTDIGGIRRAEQEAAQRICALGYSVLLPNIFYRVGKPPLLAYPLKLEDPKTQQRFAELKSSLPPAAVERDASAYVDFLASQPGVREGKFGVVGYCFSGAFAMRMAAARPEKIAAVASFHAGGLYNDAPDSPHTVLPRMKARLYFGHAVEDRSMPKEAIEKFESALAAWGGKFESETYAGAHHSWTTLDSPVYDPPQAERAFEKMMALFAAAVRG